MANEETKVMSEKDRELGTKNVKSLFVNYSIVTFWGMLAQAIMVIAEGVIIGAALGRSGFATISVVMPLETLNLALGSGLGIGVSTIAGIKLGDGDEEGARKVFSTVFWFMAIVMTLFAAIIFVKAAAVSRFLGAPEELVGECVIFARAFMIGFPFATLGQMIGSVLYVDEKPGIASFAMGAASLISLGILYITVMVFKVGIVGAGIYYGASLGLSFFAIYHFLFDKKTIFKIHLADLKIDWKLVMESIKVALPYLGFQLAIFVYTLSINKLLSRYGTQLELATFGIINSYISYCVLIISQTMTKGLQPIVSFNYGAKKTDRLIDLVKFSTIVHFVVLMVISLLVVVFVKPIMGLFAGGDVELIEQGSVYVRIFMSLAGLGKTAYFISCYYQAINRVTTSTLIGVSRHLFVVPLMFIMSAVLGVMGVWYAQVVADVLSFVLAVAFISKEVHKLKTQGL